MERKSYREKLLRCYLQQDEFVDLWFYNLESLVSACRLSDAKWYVSSSSTALQLMTYRFRGFKSEAGFMSCFFSASAWMSYSLCFTCNLKASVNVFKPKHMHNVNLLMYVYLLCLLLRLTPVQPPVQHSAVQFLALFLHLCFAAVCHTFALKN